MTTDRFNTPSPESIAGRLIDSLNAQHSLEAAYADWVELLVHQPIWSPGSPESLRIPWRSAREAHRCPLFKEAFESPGLYLFGNGDGVPVYLGKTERQALWKRLSGRYVRGKRCQCQLAADYEPALIERGMAGFPDEVREWYRKNFSGTTRLKGAVRFARDGIDGIWFTILPIADKTTIGKLESRLIRLANERNRSQGHPAMLNKQDA